MDMQANLPWIIALSVLFAVVLLLLCLLCYFGREVGRIRREVWRVKEQPPPPPPVVALAPVQAPGRGRVDLEAPPSDWPMPAMDSPLSGHRELMVPPSSGDAKAQVVMMHPLRVKIVRAEGPVTRPVYCVCQIRGKPLSKTTTGVVNEASNPTWNHEASLPDFCRGDTLSFLVYDQDWGKPDELLGEASLPGERFLDRDLFDEALPLSQARGSTAAPQGPWTCPRCTVENTAGDRICNVCEAERPQAVVASALSLHVQVTTAVWDPSTTPFFTTRWLALDAVSRGPVMGEFAMRNDWDGEVGFRFKTRTAVVIAALGRQAPAGVVRDAAVVTLWSDETQGELATANVGPASRLEGGYAFAALDRPLLLEAHKAFRISQHCFPGMADLWFDGCAEPGDLSRESSARYLEFLGSVYHGGRSFPSLVDRERCEHRRVGMLNLKLLGEDPAAEAERFRQSGALALGGGGLTSQAGDEATQDLMQIRLICMSPAPKGQEAA